MVANERALTELMQNPHSTEDLPQWIHDAENKLNDPADTSITKITTLEDAWRMCENGCAYDGDGD